MLLNSIRVAYKELTPMRKVLHKNERLTVAEKVSRLAARLNDPEWRQYGALLLSGKLLGLGVLMLGIFVVSSVFFSTALAADVEVKAADVINPVNTVWTLIAAFL